MKQVLQEVTHRIRERSAPTRTAYLARIDKLAMRQRGSDRMGCANVCLLYTSDAADE